MRLLDQITMTIDNLYRFTEAISIDFMMADGAKVTVFSTLNFANIYSLISLVLKHVVLDVLLCLYSK